jgi:hypothetical protein
LFKILNECFQSESSKECIINMELDKDKLFIGITKWLGGLSDLKFIISLDMELEL